MIDYIGCDILKKLIIIICLLCVFFNSTVLADVLGTVSGGYNSDLGLGSFFYKTEFTGGTRGNQAEHYIEYTPNNDITPVVVSGDKLWGSIDMYDANKYIMANGLRSKGAINADFFSFKTGLSMGYTITNGEIVATVTDTLPAIGFRSDGTAFIDKLNVKTTVFNGDESAEITFINKWCQPGFDPIYLLTDYFGETTKTQSKCLYVIGEIQKGKISLNENATMVVDDVFEYDGEIKIPDNKAILLIDVEGGEAKLMEFMRNIQIGDELIIQNECIDSEKNIWHEATEVCSTITPQLLKDKEIGTGFEAGINPRTAAGITADGKVILYTLDGRKPGYSNGATLKELAERMLELGCVDAINFDGGGSTAIGAKFGFTTDFKILNNPSDGYPRKVANYIFLRDNRLPTGIPKEIKYSNFAKHIYIGASQKIEVDAVYDSAEYKINDYEFKISSDDAEINGHEIKFNKKGTVDVYVSVGDYTDALSFEVFDSVDSFKVYNTETWEEVKEIILNKGELYSVQLRAVPYADEKELLLGEGVTWNIDKKIGQISNTGYILIDADKVGSGNIEVELGGITKKIPITIVDSSFFDIENHWSKNKVNFLASKGILNGVETESGLAFFPDNNMTRVEFAATVVRYLGITPEDYNDSDLDFIDSNDIPQWSENIVKAAVSEGIMNGITNDGGKTVSFEANSAISRAEAIAVIGRTIDYQSSQDRLYSDDSIIPEWAKKEVYKLSELKILQGYSDDTIKPMNKVTRAEAASMIYNALNSEKDMQ